MPNQHDILTGSDSTGRAVAGDMDTTCTNYTSNGDGKGSVMLGHHDRIGRRQLVVELRARIAWLQPAESGGYGWCGAAVLLRGELESLTAIEARRSSFQLHFPGFLIRNSGRWRLGVGS